ncbi:MAG: GNAT family N-acetyltransferase [Chloroflexi bacterium]|nr:GNAT family N-acetyltransferase [Chloroflexota bacterium]
MRAFTPGDLDAAARLLAARHRTHRQAEPLLDTRHEDEAIARADLETALSLPEASGVVAVRGSSVVGYLLGAPKDFSIWGGNVWVEAAGHATEPEQPEIVRELYTAIAGTWVEAGWTNQHVLVPATDRGLVEAWFSLDFGQQHLHAIREVGSTAGVVPRSELTVRRARRDDIPVLAELELVLPRHLAGSPVFSRLPIPSLEEVAGELAADFDDPAYTTFVVEHDGHVIGDAIACSLEVSSSYVGPNRPRDTAFLGYAAVLPEARGLGAGRLLGEAVLAWARDEGYSRVMTDWRSTNLEADRAWRGLGFRPVFRRLHRLIG